MLTAHNKPRTALYRLHAFTPGEDVRAYDDGPALEASWTRSHHMRPNCSQTRRTVAYARGPARRSK